MGLSIYVLQRPRLDIYSTCSTPPAKLIKKTVLLQLTGLEPLARGVTSLDPRLIALFTFSCSLDA